MGWESQKDVSAVLAKDNVPKDSIRLRILANSDSPEDQQVKRTIRDRVISDVSTWAGQAKNVEEARLVIRSHLPELRQRVKATLQEQGFTYPSDVQLGPTEFPTKMYGTQVFPAGTYEAVLITLGNAEGRNWWCVMFPPLCFVDISSGDTATKTKQVDNKTEEQVASQPGQPEGTEKEVSTSQPIVNDNASSVKEEPFKPSLVEQAVDKLKPQPKEQKSQVEMRFFFVDMIKKVANFFS